MFSSICLTYSEKHGFVLIVNNRAPDMLRFVHRALESFEVSRRPSLRYLERFKVVAKDSE